MTSTQAQERTTRQQDNEITTPNKDAVVIENSSSTDESTANEHPQFQAAGIIKGEVKFHDDEKKSISVTVGNKEYGLECNRRHSDARTGLKKVIAKTGETTQRLIVYPKVMHFPKKDQPHRLWFQLIGFEIGNYENSISPDLKDNEFKICGLWQFIPVCQYLFSGN